MFRLSLLLFFLLFSIVSCYCPDDYIYNVDFNKCYKYASTAKTYSDAQQDCFYDLGNLTWIDDAFENTVVAGTASSFLGNTDAWIGAWKPAKHWEWQDGSRLEYHNWDAGQDDSHNFSKVNTISYKWKKVDQTGTAPYICATCPRSPLRCDNEWVYFAKTESCYFAEPLEDKWVPNEKVCHESKGHLASIHSQEENDFLATATMTGVKMLQNQQLWIGLNRLDDGKTWTYSDNSPVDFLPWVADPQPGEDCATLIADSEWYETSSNIGKWRAFNCTSKMRSFICKKPAVSHGP